MGTLTWRQDSGITYWQLHDDEEYVAWLTYNRQEDVRTCLAWKAGRMGGTRHEEIAPGMHVVPVDNLDDAKAYVVALYRLGG